MASSPLKTYWPSYWVWLRETSCDRDCSTCCDSAVALRCGHGAVGALLPQRVDLIQQSVSALSRADSAVLTWLVTWLRFCDT